MVLFNQFPKSFSKTIFIFILSFIYGVIYCAPPNENTHNFILFANDFNVKGRLWWFIQTMADYILIGTISYAACVESKDRLLKSIFFAILIDSMLSGINLIMFSDIYNDLSTSLRNGGMSSSFLFAYVILFKPNSGD